MMIFLRRFWVLFGLILPFLWTISCGSGNDMPEPDPIPPTDNLPEIIDYIKKAEIIGKNDAKVEVSGIEKKIKVVIGKNAGRSHLVLRLTLASDVSLIYPQALESVYDLRSTSEKVWLRYGNQQIQYEVMLEETHANEIDPVSLGWKDVSSSFGTLPQGFNVYQSPSNLQGRLAKAFIAVVDMRQKNKLKALSAEPAMTPDNYYAQYKYPLIINAAYMYNAKNVCLFVREGALVRANVQEVQRKDNRGELTTFNATRGVFGLMKDGSYRSEWVYTINNITYAYANPLKNREGDVPLPRPSDKYPEKAEIVEMQDVIGAGPVLIHRSKVKNTWDYEFWDDTGGIMPNNPVQRTAIGVTENQKLVFFVCEGRNVTSGIAGLTTAEIANVLVELGCVEALNYDGGGSSCMLINGKNTIIPNGGASAQRPVSTAYAILSE